MLMFISMGRAILTVALNENWSGRSDFSQKVIIKTQILDLVISLKYKSFIISTIE